MKAKILQSPLLFSIFGALGVVFLIFEFHRVGDFSFYYIAAEKVFSVDNIYALKFGDESNFQYFGSPVLTILFHPFTLLPLTLAAVLWKFICLLLLWRCWAIMNLFFQFKFETVKKKRLFELIAFLAIAFILYTNFHLVQLTVFLLYASLEGLYQIQIKKRALLGALLISTSIYTKVSPIVLLPYLLYRKEWKASILIVTFLAALAALPSIFLGWEKSLELWQSWFQSINPVDNNAAFDMNNNKNQGLAAWLSSLLIAEIRHAESSVFIQRYIADLASDTVLKIILTARLSLVAFTLYFLKFPPFIKAQSKLLQFREISYVLLVIPLLLPQQRSYNFLFLWPAIVYIVYGLQTNVFDLKASRRWIIAILIFALIVLNLELLLGAYRKYYWHFKTLTYASFFLLGLLAFLKPKADTQVLNTSS